MAKCKGIMLVEDFKRPYRYLASTYLGFIILKLPHLWFNSREVARKFHSGSLNIQQPVFQSQILHLVPFCVRYIPLFISIRIIFLSLMSQNIFIIASKRFQKNNPFQKGISLIIRLRYRILCMPICKPVPIGSILDGR